MPVDRQESNSPHTAYAYDERGNQTYRYLSADQSKYWHYSWNGENRLIQAQLVDGGTTLRTVSFKYDPFGRRVQKLVAGLAPQVPVPLTTSYTYDSEDIVLQTQSDGTATIATQYVHGPGIDEPLAMVAGGQSYYYHADGLGSIVAISDSAQNVVERYSYDAFGMVMASDPGFANSYAYTGREWDMELGLYYYRARYYDPMEGRFVSKDPIGFAGGDVNVYRYVQNNPINRLDPTGLAWIYDTGTNTLQQTDSSGNVTNSWPAGSGPWGNGQLPPGTYTLPSPPVPVPPNHPNQPSYCDGSGNCWWQPITPNFPTNRTGLGIHPDGNVPGTAGCIGATDNDTNNLRDALMNDQGPLTVR